MAYYGLFWLTKSTSSLIEPNRPEKGDIVRTVAESAAHYPSIYTISPNPTSSVAIRLSYRTIYLYPYQVHIPYYFTRIFLTIIV
jgi:hypothetical protein